MTKPDTPFPKHWRYYIFIKWALIVGAITHRAETCLGCCGVMAQTLAEARVAAVPCGGRADIGCDFCRGDRGIDGR